MSTGNADGVPHAGTPFDRQPLIGAFCPASIPMNAPYFFDYVSSFEAESFRRDAIVVRAKSRDYSEESALVGHRPKLRFSNDRLLLIAADCSNAAVRWASFPIGDAVLLVARPGDALHVLRTAPSDLALWIVRSGHLVLAVGALSGASLDDHVRVSGDVEDGPGRRRLVEVSVESGRARLATRESATLDGYELYVERASAWPSDEHGSRECVSIVRAAGDPSLRNAAMRSAVLLAQERPDVANGERWDGHLIRWVHRR